MKDKFIVDNYFCKPNELQESMNEHSRNGYRPKEIKVTPYQDRVEGFIIYELTRVEHKDIKRGSCGYCTGRPLVERGNLMINSDKSYKVFINQCNFLEDSVIGNTVPHSLLA